MYRGAGSTSDLLSYRCLYMVFLVGFNVGRSRFLPVKTTSDLLSFRCLYMVFLVGINVWRSRFHVRLTVL